MARPTDGDACIPLIVEAGGSLLGWGLGDADASTCAILVRRCWQRILHPLGPTTTTVALLDGQIVGAVLGCPSRQWLQAETDNPVHLETVLRGDALKRAQDRSRQQSAARPPLPPDAFYLASLAVASAARRQGVGTALIAAARARGVGRVVVVEVVEGNDTAERLYAQQGFTEQLRWQAGDGPVVRRMVDSR